MQNHCLNANQYEETNRRVLLLTEIQSCTSSRDKLLFRRLSVPYRCHWTPTRSLIQSRRFEVDSTPSRVRVVANIEDYWLKRKFIGLIKILHCIVATLLPVLTFLFAVSPLAEANKNTALLCVFVRNSTISNRMFCDPPRSQLVVV